MQDYLGVIFQTMEKRGAVIPRNTLQWAHIASKLCTVRRFLKMMVHFDRTLLGRLIVYIPQET